MTVAIPTSPPAPQASDPVNFEPKADALLAAWPGIIAAMNEQNAENNAIAAALPAAAAAAAAAAPGSALALKMDKDNPVGAAASLGGSCVGLTFATQLTATLWHIATLPASDAGRFDGLLIEGILGHWVADKVAFRVGAKNRDGFTAHYYEGSSTGTSGLEFYSQPDGSVHVYMALRDATYSGALQMMGVQCLLYPSPTPVSAATGTLLWRQADNTAEGGGGGAAARVSFKYQATAGQTSFVAAYTPGLVDVYMNGVKLAEGLDFTATSGTECVLTSGASAGDEPDVVEIVAFEPFDVADTYTRSQIDGLIEAAAAGGGLGGAAVTWASITGKPSTFPPSAHTHTIAISDVTGLSDALAAAGGGTSSSVAWADVTGKPSTFTPAAHTHAIADVAGLSDALAAAGGGGAGAGALVLLGTINAAAAASVDITPIDTWAATYDSLLIVGSGISVSGSSAQTISAALKIGGTWLTSGYSFGASYYPHYSPMWQNTGSQSAPSILLGNTRGAQETGSTVAHLATLNMDVTNLGGCASLRCTLDGAIYVGNIVSGITTQAFGRSVSQLGALQGIRLISSAASAQGAAAPAAGGVVGTITGAFRVYGRVKA